MGECTIVLNWTVCQQKFRTQQHKPLCKLLDNYVCVVVNCLSQVIFVFVLFLGMVVCTNEVETKEK